MRFVPLGEWLAAASNVPAAAVEEPPVVAPPSVLPAAPEVAAAVRDARVFRAALADAFDALLADLLRHTAADVLARELRLAPADVETLARTLLRERDADGPVRLRVAAADAGIRCDVPVLVDEALAQGDAILELRHGTIDARLGVRVADVLEAVQP